MADYKVHPMPGKPSAPPYSRSSSIGTQSTLSSVGIEMPADERAVKKEEERSLMQEQQQQQKDFIYKMPEPLPTDHPSLRTAAKRRKRRGCCRSCCCCLAWLCAVIAGIIIILGVAALVLYLVLKPKTPDFSVTDATITAFNLTDKPMSAGNISPGVSLYLNADVTFDVRAENPNKKIGIYYDKVEVTLFYEGENIGTGSIPGFYQGHKNTTLLDLNMKGQDVGLTTSLGSTLQATLKNANASVPLDSKTLAQVRIKIGSWKSSDTTFQINCNVEMSNPTAPNPHLLSKSCSFKVKKFLIFKF